MVLYWSWARWCSYMMERRMVLCCIWWPDVMQALSQLLLPLCCQGKLHTIYRHTEGSLGVACKAYVSVIIPCTVQ